LSCAEKEVEVEPAAVIRSSAFARKKEGRTWSGLFAGLVVKIQDTKMAQTSQP
jgi:hypothetical protein